MGTFLPFLFFSWDQDGTKINPAAPPFSAGTIYRIYCTSTDTIIPIMSRASPASCGHFQTQSSFSACAAPGEGAKAVSEWSLPKKVVIELLFKLFFLHCVPFPSLFAFLPLIFVFFASFFFYLPLFCPFFFFCLFLCPFFFPFKISFLYLFYIFSILFFSFRLFSLLSLISFPFPSPCCGCVPAVAAPGPLAATQGWLCSVLSCGRHQMGTEPHSRHLRSHRSLCHPKSPPSLDFGVAPAPLGAPSPALDVVTVPLHRDQPGVPLPSQDTSVPLAWKRCVCFKINPPASFQTAVNSRRLSCVTNSAWFFLCVIVREMLFKNHCSYV